MTPELDHQFNQDSEITFLEKWMNCFPGCVQSPVENDEARNPPDNIISSHHDNTLLRNELESLREDLRKEIQSKENLIKSWQEKYKHTSTRLKEIEDTLEQERKERQQAIQDLRESRSSSEPDEDTKVSLIEEVKMIQSYIYQLLSSSDKEEQLKKEMKIQHEQTVAKLESTVAKLESTVAELERQNDDLRQKLNEATLAKEKSEKETDKAISLCEEVIRRVRVKEKNKSDAAIREKDEAVAICHDAVEKKNAAEKHLENMKQFIIDAKIIDKTNEMLHKLLEGQMKERLALNNKIEDLRGRIRVNVRIRPLSQSEIEKSCSEALIKADNRTCQIHDPLLFRGQTKTWEFDQIYSGQKYDGNSQEQIFDDTKSLIQSAIDGFNVSMFAYGQTGGGKTYTMGLDCDNLSNDISSKCELHEDTGMAPRVAFEIFRLLEGRESAFETSVTVNMFELYNHYLRDLLNTSAVDPKEKYNTNLQIKLAEHSKSGLVEVDGAVSVTVNNPSELMSIIRLGTQRRATSSTVFNADSSRSHLILSILIKQVNRRTKDVVFGKFSFVDLAGSERVNRSHVEGIQLKEAQSINKSLSALGDVINALTTQVKHVPFRNHPLTMLMSDSIGGNAKTVMFVCCSPADYNKGETCSALDFAQRCKLVTNNAKTSSASEQAVHSRLQSGLQHIQTKSPAKAKLPSLDEIKKKSVQLVSVN